MAEALVANTSCRMLVEYCRVRAFDPTPLLARAGIEEAALTDHEGRLPESKVAALWRLAMEELADPSLAILVAEAVPFGTYPMFNYLAMGAATVGDGLGRAVRYFPIINPSVRFRVVEQRDRVEVEMLSNRGTSRLARPYVEYVLGTLVLHSRRASGRHWAPIRVDLGFPKPVRTIAHERLFGCPVRFRPDAGHALLISRGVWEQPTTATMPGLLSVLEAHAERAMEAVRRDDSTTNRLKAVLVAELRGGDPRLESAARRLGLGPRTLQRRLAEEKQTFAAVLDETRKLLAEAHVKEGATSLTELALALGFSEQSAFTRAFRRWFGHPPSTVRRRGEV